MTTITQSHAFLLVSAADLCNLPAGFAVSHSLFRLFYIMKKDVTERTLQI